MVEDRDLAGNNGGLDPDAYWVLGLGLVVIAAFFWGFSDWMQDRAGSTSAEYPFFQVTNREYSLFLWEHPDLIGNKSVPPEEADVYVKADPRKLFRYHTWDRLIRWQTPVGEIPADKFLLFLEEDPQWKPAFWQDAPKGYGEFLERIVFEGGRDLSEEPFVLLPEEVRLAYQGWVNLTKNHKEIAEFRPTWPEIEDFLLSHPNYVRPLWQNVVDSDKVHYLKEEGQGDVVPQSALTYFLQSAVYNWKK